MTSPAAGRATETFPDLQIDQSTSREPAMSDAAAHVPDSAAIAEESAAIYPDTNEGAPTPEAIAIEAYRIYMARGAADGHDVEDWLEAERRVSESRRAKP